MKLAENYHLAANRLLTKKAPLSLISKHTGLPEYGHFDGVIESLGLANFQYHNEMDKPAGALAKHFHYKQFQFVCINTPRYVIGVALADIRYLGSAFCYLYDIKNNELIESSLLRPLGVGYRTSQSPLNGEAGIAGRKLSVDFTIQDGQWHLTLATDRIDAKLKLLPSPLSLPMAMCAPCGYNGWTYTQKHNGLKLSGELTINHEPQPLNQALAGYDFSAGYMRRETSWRWASINAHIEEGVMGLNLAAGVNETGANENVFWINGERHLLGPVHFDFKRKGEGAEAWRIYSDDGRINLTFTPNNCRKEKLNLLVLKSNFRQFIGRYSGEIIDSEGKLYRLNNILGLSEDHYAKW